jgi:hypothetical protein
MAKPVETAAANSPSTANPDISRHRARWRANQELIDPRHLIFVDETWTKTNMTRLCGWAPKGERLIVGSVNACSRSHPVLATRSLAARSRFESSRGMASRSLRSRPYPSNRLSSESPLIRMGTGSGATSPGARRGTRLPSRRRFPKRSADRARRELP